ncbi:MAG: hypothetical protein JRJ11_16440 [Deltaproteobacteria bacterium]|nr:hypothetical protein [Deltaproteobacteria bacterium]
MVSAFTIIAVVRVFPAASVAVAVIVFSPSSYHGKHTVYNHTCFIAGGIGYSPFYCYLWCVYVISI